MKGRKSSKRWGNLVFLIPVLAVLGLVIFGILTNFNDQSGTLIVEAATSARYAPSVQLHPQVFVGSVTESAPFNLTLAQGQYTVDYGPVSWYYTPSPRSIVVSGGKTQFAVGQYSPILRVVDITNNGFNATQVTALHGVTPVSWVNKEGSPLVFQITGAATITLNPSQNYTTIFAGTGSFYFSVKGTNFSGTVDSQ